MSAREIPNFVLADAEHLPFKDESFNVTFSSHTIEHVGNPSLMVREMCRAAKKKVIVRCPHRRGSGAKMPYHVNYFDEEWFKEVSNRLGYKNRQFVTTYDYPISSRIKRIVPNKVQTTLLWRGLKHFERSRLNMRTKIPFGMEAWIKKHSNRIHSDNVRFVVVFNNLDVFEKCFASSPYVSKDRVTSYFNRNNEPLPRFFNKTVQKYRQENVWLFFAIKILFLERIWLLVLRARRLKPCTVQ